MFMSLTLQKHKEKTLPNYRNHIGWELSAAARTKMDRNDIRIFNITSNKKLEKKPPTVMGGAITVTELENAILMNSCFNRNVF